MVINDHPLTTFSFGVYLTAFPSHRTILTTYIALQSNTEFSRLCRDTLVIVELRQPTHNGQRLDSMQLHQHSFSSTRQGRQRHTKYPASDDLSTAEQVS